MKRSRLAWKLSLVVLAVLMVGRAHSADVGTAFTYQGFLENGSGPVTDTCDFRFGLWDGAADGMQVGDSPQTVSGVSVSGGQFGVTLDFGAGVFSGDARWLEIKVKCPGDVFFVKLSPRVELTPAPYSIRAGEGVGGPNALNVTPSGDVGIGTTTPAAQLDVNGAARTTTLEITGGLPPVPSLVGWGDNNFGQIYVTSGVFSAVAAGSQHSLAIASGGTLAGWGDNSYGQIYVPSGTFIAVVAGGNHGLAIRADGTLVGWGYNDEGQINVPSGTFTAVAAGYSHSVAIRSDGTLVGWGRNNVGQTNVPAGTFIAVVAGGNHGLAIRADGTLVGWGNNQNGQIDVPSGTFIAVAAGASHSLAIRTDGTLVGWGSNGEGEINVPAGTFTAVAAGWSHSLAIRADGTLVGWGNNNRGQTDVPAGTFTAVAGGERHSLAIRSDATPSDPALRLLVDSAIKPGSNTWTIFSDRRLKKNIEPLSGALERLLQLRGVTFQWLDPGSQGGITGTQMGLIADEVQRAFPQWVGRDPKGYQTLTVGGFEALTAEALRELRAEKNQELDRMRAEKDAQIVELNEREGVKDQRINELEARLAAIEVLLGRSSNSTNGGGR